VKALRSLAIVCSLVAALVGPLSQRAALADSYCQGTPSSVAVNISTATTTQLVAGVAGTNVYVCGVQGTVVGTNPTVQFTGGASNCTVSIQTFTGTFAAVTGTLLIVGSGGYIVFQTTITGTGVCIVSGGTTPSIQGILTYVQR
jgi:hypothetical protein